MQRAKRQQIKGLNMKPARVNFLNLRRLPYILSREEVGHLINLEDYEIDILIWTGKLPVLASCKGNEKKEFGLKIIERMLEEDPEWPNSARATIRGFLRRKNSSRKKKGSNDGQQSQQDCG